MRKVVMLLFMLIACSILAVPAFAQGAEAGHAGTNWVALTSGFAMAFAVGLAALGQSKVAASWV